MKDGFDMRKASTHLGSWSEEAAVMKRWNQQGGGGGDEDGEERGFVVGRSLEMEREVEERRVSRVRV